MPTLLEYGHTSYTCPFLLLSPYAIWHQTPPNNSDALKQKQGARKHFWKSKKVNI